MFETVRSKELLLFALLPALLITSSFFNYFCFVWSYLKNSVYPLLMWLKKMLLFERAPRFIILGLGNKLRFMSLLELSKNNGGHFYIILWIFCIFFRFAVSWLSICPFIILWLEWIIWGRQTFLVETCSISLSAFPPGLVVNVLDRLSRWRIWLLLRKLLSSEALSIILFLQMSVCLFGITLFSRWMRYGWNSS